MPRGSMPVIVGAGQSINHWDGSGDADLAPSALKLAVEASRRAFEDAGCDLAGQVDTLAVTRTWEDSVPFGYPHGHNENLPGTIARDLNIAPAFACYEREGGQSPQKLVSEMAARIHAGNVEIALVTGGEAFGAGRLSKKKEISIDWSDASDLPFEDRAVEERLLNRTEIKHGMIAPAYFYGLIENAIAHREGRTRTQHRAAMSKLFAEFSIVAESNPFAQFPAHRTEEFLATPSKDNFEFVDPFLKWHVAQDAVNMGAAVLLMSEEKADELGIAQAKRVYLHGSGDAYDSLLSERLVLDRAWAMDIALNRALDAAGKSASDISVFDLYSCFPCAVFCSTSVLGVDWQTDRRALTVTGGLPYAGGPGNNYSLHGIAAIISNLRKTPGSFGLVLANGGWMTKEAAGVYSTERPAEFIPVAPAAVQTELMEINPEPGEGVLESYTVVHGRGGPKQGIAFGKTANGSRFLANADADALVQLREEESQIGRKVTVVTEAEVNTFSFAE